MAKSFVIPVYVELPCGFERAIDALESYLRRAGYAFHTGQPVFQGLEEVVQQSQTETARLDPVR